MRRTVARFPADVEGVARRQAGRHDRRGAMLHTRGPDPLPRPRATARATLSTSTATPALQIPRIRHAEAMRITVTENALLLALLQDLGPSEWNQATDCTGWTVRDIVVHVIASAQGQASVAEFARQAWTGWRLVAEVGGVQL